MAEVIICDVCKETIESNDETSKYFSLEVNAGYPHTRKSLIPEIVYRFHLCGKCISNLKDLIEEHYISDFWNN